MRNQVPFKINPDERIRMIRCSLRCLGFGAASAAVTLASPIAVLLILNLPSAFQKTVVLALSWLPLAGLALAFVSWTNLFQARNAAQGEWNPAAAQLLWGRILSALGVFISMLLLFFFVCAMLKLLGEEI